PERVLVTRHALHDDVVVFAGGVVAAAPIGRADDGFGEVVEGAGIDAGAEQTNLRVRPVRANLVPARDPSLRGRLPELLQFGNRHRGGPVVLWIDDDGQAVIRHRQLDVVNAGLRALRVLRATDRPGGIGDIDLAA